MLASAAAFPAGAAPRAAALRTTTARGVFAGQTMTVAWDALDGRRFDEMEVVLSLDGGRTWPVRISRDLSPSATGASFRVPFLRAEEAVVALRAGRKGVKESEEILAESVSFRIHEPAVGAGETLWRVRGEWRTAETMGGQTPDGPAVPGLSGPPSLSRKDGEGPDVEDDGDDTAVDGIPPQETELPLPHRSPARLLAPDPSMAPAPLLLSRRE
jgi:hypothetical protein